MLLYVGEFSFHKTYKDTEYRTKTIDRMPQVTFITIIQEI